MKALVVANGSMPGVDRLRKAIAQADYVLAVDGGANALEDCGFAADAVLGDFDSLRDGVLPDARRIPAPDQDHTDIDKAIQYLVDAGAASIVMTGVTGNRLDHTFGALNVLVKYGRIVDLTLLDDVGTAKLVDKSIVVDVYEGRTVSLLPMGLVTGVVTSGLKWPLAGDCLRPGARDGISNEAAADSISVTVDSGDLVVYVHHGPGAT